IALDRALGTGMGMTARNGTGKGRAAGPNRATLVPIGIDEIEEEPMLESTLLRDLAVPDDRLANGRIERSVLDGVTLVDVNANALVVHSTDLERTNLSAAVLETASFSGCRFDGCKLTGTQLDRAVLQGVTFVECRADMARFQYAKLRRVRFERCQLR